ncbi:MAG TPA: hypothetical protein VIW46_12805 [Acidimicrobiia bacterium]
MPVVEVVAGARTGSRCVATSVPASRFAGLSASCADPADVSVAAASVDDGGRGEPASGRAIPPQALTASTQAMATMALVDVIHGPFLQP